MKLKELKQGDIFKVFKIKGYETYTTYFDFALYDEKIDSRNVAVLLISERYGIARIKIGLNKEVFNLQGETRFWYAKAFKAVFEGKYGYSDNIRSL